MTNALQSIYLKENYTAYLKGAEVESTVNTKNKNLEPGQHILVFPDSVAASTPLTVPANKETDNVGVEGLVTQVNRVTDLKKGEIVQHLKLKRI
jgi:hypothetical protein